MRMPLKTDFGVGDAVIVKPGVMDPDEPTRSLAGWQGWVTEIYPKEGTLLLNWDSLTLRAIPDAQIRACEIEGLAWQTMGLEIAEVSPAPPRDTPAEAEALYEEILSHHRWDHLSDLNPGITDLLGPLGKADELTYLKAWDKHLHQALRFPFEARVEEQLLRGPVQVGAIVQVLGISELNELYGVLVSVRLGRSSYTLPLCDLEATDCDSPNYQPLNDYVVWFANR